MSKYWATGGKEHLGSSREEALCLHLLQVLSRSHKLPNSRPLLLQGLS